MTECRICGSKLNEVLNLGEIYPSSFISNLDVTSEYSKAPLVLAECDSCGLIQLRDTIDIDSMYKKQYWYMSSLNKSMVSSLKNIVDEIEERMHLNDEDMVIDIGANDCTLLSLYTKDLLKVAFEPAPNMRPKKDAVTVWIPDYFSKETFTTYFSQPNHPEWLEQKAKVITAIAMFYDLPDPNKFVEDVKFLLDKDGIFVVQFTDLLSMIATCAFDNICFEHLEYYRLIDIVRLFDTHGLSVIDVSSNDVNGGSIRITACHKGVYSVHSSVASSLDIEKQYFQLRDMAYFAKCIEDTKFKVREFLTWAKKNNKTTYLLGASTKGNTLLQICGITNEDTPYAAEVNKDKLGMLTLGSNVEIISEEEALIKHPDFFLALVWHFKGNLITNKNILSYMEAGGELVFPLPYFHIAFYDKYSKTVKEVRI